MCACVRARVCGHSARWETAVFRVEISHGLIIHTTAEEKLAKSEYGHRSSYGFYHWFLVPFCFKTGCVLFLISRIFLQTEKKGKFKLCIEDVYSAVYNYRLLNISQKNIQNNDCGVEQKQQQYNRSAARPTFEERSVRPGQCECEARPVGVWGQDK